VQIIKSKKIKELISVTNTPPILSTTPLLSTLSLPVTVGKGINLIQTCKHPHSFIFHKSRKELSDKKKKTN